MRFLHAGNLLPLLGLLALTTASPSQEVERRYGGGSTIDRDVIVIGGGSSGTHAAIQLQRLGHSVALVEKTNRLGGHVNTFVDSRTNQKFDYGVVVYENSTATRNYFKYLDIKAQDIPSQSGGGEETLYANFATDGKVLPDGLPPSIPYSDPAAIGPALQKYLDLLAQYPYLELGYDLPDPVPEDLLLTWGDYTKKHDLGAMARVVFSFDQGMGNILSQLAVHQFKYLSKGVVNSVLGTKPLLQTVPEDNQAIYDSAQKKLGQGNLFLDGQVTEIDRSKKGAVTVTVDTPQGRKTLKGKKLLIAIQPTLSNLKGLGLDLNRPEQNIFKQFNNSYYWDMVIQDSGLPPNASFSPIDLAAPLGIPPAPIVEGFQPSPIGAADLTVSYYTSPYPISDDEVKQNTLKTLAKLRQANGYKSTKTPKFVGFNNHSPYEVVVSAEAVKKGFYRQLNGLQGQRDTFFTGATWQGHDSSLIWTYNNKVILPKLEAALKK